LEAKEGWSNKLYGDGVEKAIIITMITDASPRFVCRSFGNDIGLLPSSSNSSGKLLLGGEL
jgi:hypothetical protein